MKWASLVIPLILAQWAAAAESTTRPMAASRPAMADKLTVRVDPRIELFSIIFRLAGHPEYRRARIDAYARAADEHFAPVKDHAAVKLARVYRSTFGISFDAPMSLAVLLTDTPELKEAVTLEPRPESLDSRWRIPEARTFIAAANDFAVKGRFAEFFEVHRAQYEASAGRLRKMAREEAQFDWFESFFGGKADVRPNLVIGMLLGPNNYGPRSMVGQRVDVYSILGAMAADEQGIVIYSPRHIPLLVHEFGHSYVNPAVDRHEKILAGAGQKLFNRVEQRMRAQAYGSWQTMMRESVLRACVVRYLLAQKGRAAALREVLDQQMLGFVWTGELVTVLDEYERHRDQYPDFDAFMPRVAEFFEQYLARTDLGQN